MERQCYGKARSGSVKNVEFSKCNGTAEISTELRWQSGVCGALVKNWDAMEEHGLVKAEYSIGGMAGVQRRIAEAELSNAPKCAVCLIKRKADFL